MKPLVVRILILGACARVVLTAQAPPPDFKELSDDTKLTTPSGATFTATRGWHLARSGDTIILEEPQRELAAALVEINAPTLEDAIAQAWKRWKPDFSRTVRLTTKPPVTGSSGWDEIGQIVYETAATERRVVMALARRKGSIYYVTLVDGALAAIERRGAQLNATFNGLEVAGREEENLAGRKAHALDGARAEKFLAFAEQARIQSKVPGVAIAIVQNGRIVLEKGLGVRELGKPEPVTASTLFMIGSMTKPLTSLLMARMVDRGKFRWDTPVTTLLPSFALGDREVTKRVTMAHTVCACTGLPRWDMEFIFEWNKATPASRIELLRGMKPTTGFGETFQYSNLMVASGGYVAALAATGNKNLRRAYVDAMGAQVLGPVGMKSTVLDIDVAKTRVHAQPHGRTFMFDPEPIPLEIERGVDSVMPAGGAWSNARDMARWVLLELGEGQIDGRQVISESSMLERRKPRATMGAKTSYGLALMIDESRGRVAISHGGNTFGFSSDATFFPEHNLGIVILTNAAVANAYIGAVRRRLIELLFDAAEEADKQLTFGISQVDEVMKKRLDETSLQPDPAFIGPLIGSWTTAGLGEIKITRNGNAFVFDAGEWTSPIGEHRDQSGARRLILTGAPFAGFTFWPQTKDGRPGLLFETAQQKYWFERTTPADTPVPPAASAQAYPPAFPRQNARKMLETDRIVVWDVVWPKGQPSPLHRHVFDQVGTYYQAGGRAITPLDGPRRETTTPVGNISTTRKGTTHVEEGTTDPPLRAVFIELKSETASAQGANQPLVPPRRGARQVHAEDRVTVSDFTWSTAGTRATTQYERDTLIVWLTPGTLRVTAERGEAEVLTVRAGSVRYRGRGTVETEELTGGSPRAMIFEFR